MDRGRRSADKTARDSVESLGGGGEPERSFPLRRESPGGKPRDHRSASRGLGARLLAKSPCLRARFLPGRGLPPPGRRGDDLPFPRHRRQERFARLRALRKEPGNRDRERRLFAAFRDSRVGNLLAARRALLRPGEQAPRSRVRVSFGPSPPIRAARARPPRDVLNHRAGQRLESPRTEDRRELLSPPRLWVPRSIPPAGRIASGSTFPNRETSPISISTGPPPTGFPPYGSWTARTGRFRF